MESSQPTKATIRPIWKVIIGTMFFVTLTGASWHFGEMRDMRAGERGELRTKRAELSRLGGYRDSVKNDGLLGGKTYLDGVSGVYGF